MNALRAEQVTTSEDDSRETAAAPDVTYAPEAVALDPKMMEMLELFTYTQQKINDHLEKAFAVDHLSLAHYRALFFVMRYPGITVSGLIDKLNITKQSLARVLADLIRGRAPLDSEGTSEEPGELVNGEEGYLYSEVDPSDRRARMLYLTNRGDELMQWALEPVTVALSESFQGISSKEGK